VLACVAVAAGCATPPVRSVTGLRVTRVLITEDIALRASQPAPIELAAAKLEPTVQLLDRHGVLRLPPGEYSALAADGSSVKVRVEVADSKPIVFDLSNCAEPHVCGFLRDAVMAGLLDHAPKTCQTPPPPCGDGRGVCCDFHLEPSTPDVCEGVVGPPACSAFLACQPVTALDGGVTRREGCPPR
jgi:hypothetical protein